MRWLFCLSRGQIKLVHVHSRWTASVDSTDWVSSSSFWKAKPNWFVIRSFNFLYKLEWVAHFCTHQNSSTCNTKFLIICKKMRSGTSKQQLVNLVWPNIYLLKKQFKCLFCCLVYNHHQVRLVTLYLLFCRGFSGHPWCYWRLCWSKLRWP